MWNNDEYLQFMYERLILIRELLSDNGSVYLHCDWHKSHHLRCLMDEIFGTGGDDGNDSGFKSEIIWNYNWGIRTPTKWNRKHDNILMYTKTRNFTFNAEDVLEDRKMSEATANRLKYKGALIKDGNKGRGDSEKALPSDVWYIATINGMAIERLDYPTQKPEELLQKIILASSNPGDLVFDCFMGSGTTQAVAMKLGRRFIGADINLGAVETTVKRLNTVLKEDESRTGFEVYNVNNYDVFRNPVEAKALLIEALEINKMERSCFDGEKDGYMVKLMPVNRIANRQDLNEIITGVDYKSFEKAREENPNKPVANIMLVCMGHEPDLGAELIAEFKKAGFEIEVKIVDILRNNKELEFKHPSEATIVKEGNKLVIKDFYPMNLLQKLSIQQENVEDWKELAECVKIDWNYDGAVFEPAVVDYPENKKDLVQGVYEIPEDAGTIKVKITDLLDESFETELDWS